MKQVLRNGWPISELSQRLGRELTGWLFLVLALVGAPAFAAPDSKGTDFWLMFNANALPPEMRLFIAGDTATNGVVSIPGIGFSVNFSVTPGAVTTVVLPAGAEVTAVDAVTNQGIRVVANAEVSVYGLNRYPQSTDAFLGLPIDILGTDYINLGYRNVNVVNASQLGIVGTQPGTVVTITPSVLAAGRPAGVPYTISLNPGQTYQLRATGAAPADLSGTLISSTAPIAVFGGHQCANIPAGFFACDHIVEQLPPTTTWGKSFITMPLATRTGGDTFRILASTNGTVVSVNGVTVATLNRGQLHERIIVTPSTITASQPVLVAQYSNSSTFDNVTSDPFEMLIPPFEQFLASYTVTTPATGFPVNYINLVVPNAAVGSVKLDGVAIPASAYTPISGSSFSGTQRLVTIGAHNLVGPLPFGAFMYGYANFDSYGYPGGMSLSQVAVVTSLSLTPKTATGPVNQQHCVNAALRDQTNTPVPGVRVDFSVSGANTTVGFTNGDGAGISKFCYVGTNAGTDSIVASVGTLSDTATKIWTTKLACDVDGNGSIDTADLALIRAGIGQTPSVDDPRDANGDGKITMNDVRACTLQCTRASCTTN
jgi:hypothetical protein